MQRPGARPQQQRPVPGVSPVVAGLRPNSLRRRARHALRRYRLPLVLMAAALLLSLCLLRFPGISDLNVGAGHRKPKGRKEAIVGLTSWGLRPAKWRHKKLKGEPRYLNKDGRWVIPRQVQTPDAAKKTGKRQFGCLREECRGLAMEDLTDRQWRFKYKTAKEGGQFRSGIDYRVTVLLTDGTELSRLQSSRPEIYRLLYSGQEGSTYISALDGADAIGGNKGVQLRGKQRFAKRNKCTYNSLAVQPAQYRLYIAEECKELVQKTTPKTTFLLKPETGSQGQGISFHANVASVKKKAGARFFPCRENVSMPATERMLVQEYIQRPLLVKRSKFDVRVYMLIASADPFFVFYHQGYLRRSLTEYSASSKDRKVYLTNTHFQSMKQGFKLSEHIWTFEALQDYLTQEGRTGAHYVESTLEPYIKRVMRFVFEASRAKLKRRKGSFHIFGLDFMVDDRFQVHFIEANGYPGYTWSINFDTRSMVSDQFDLVQELHEAPAAVFERMVPGDRYGGFHMIFSELVEEKRGVRYDPCLEFYHNRESFEVLRMASRHFAKYTGYAAAKLVLKGRSDDDDDGAPCNTKRCA